MALLSLPLYLLTLGLFYFVVNALMLWLTSWLADLVGLGFRVRGFWTAVFGAIVITIVGWIIGLVLPADQSANWRTRGQLALSCVGHAGSRRLATPTAATVLDRAGLPRQHLPLADRPRRPRAQAAPKPRLASRVSVDSSGTGDWHIGEPMDQRAAGHAGGGRLRPVAPPRHGRFDSDLVRAATT